MINQKKKLFCIVGETASGKDTLAENLVRSNPDVFKQVCSYTTREIRDNETDGVEHYFITKEEFDKKRKRAGENVVAYTKIANEQGEGYEYMATLDEVMNSNIYIIDPNGLKYLRDHFSDKIDPIAIYIYCPYKQRELRASQSRSDFKTKFEKRVNAERVQFDHFYRHKDYDYIIYNLNGIYDEAFKTLCTITDYELNERELNTEFTSILGDEYTKEDLNDAVVFLKNVTAFYSSKINEDSMLARNVKKNYKVIRNLILSHLR